MTSTELELSPHVPHRHYSADGHECRSNWLWLRAQSLRVAAARQLFPFLIAATLALGLMIVAPAPSHGQAAADLLTAGDFAVLAGSTVTNTGSSVINGNVGVSPGTAITGFFPPGIVNGTIHSNDAVAIQAQIDLTNAYIDLENRTPTQNLTGFDLGGQTLTAGVYRFDDAAELNGTLTLNGQNDPNSVFIFQIGSTLITGSNSSVVLINGAQGSNVFWQVGSSATLGTNTVFVGNILALTSITLNTGATIICGSALARNGAVTLDSNTITTCRFAPVTVGDVLPDVPPGNEGSVAAVIDAYIAAGGTLPAEFLALLATLSPSELATALSQLTGEVGTGIAQAGTQAMNSFLSLVTNPFDNARPFAEPQHGPMVVKALGIAPVDPAPAARTRSAFASFAGAHDPRRWGVWGAGYGGHGRATGDPLGAGSHDRSVSVFGYAMGIDHRVTPATVVGMAFSGGATRYGLAEGHGSGRSEMFQAAVYSSTRIGAGYISAALAYGWHSVTTNRYVTFAGTHHLTAGFSAHNVGGRIEGGYRFAILTAPNWPARTGVTPYAAVQAQGFRTPTYSEGAVSGSSVFALSYDARTIVTVRTELGAWYDWSSRIDYGTTLVLRTRAAWAHDFWSDPSINASFQALPGLGFTVTGARPATDLLLTSAAAEIWLANGVTLAARFDGEFSGHTQKYAGTGRLRYTW